AAKTPGMDAAKADFKIAAEASNKAYGLIKLVTPATDPNELKQQNVNKYAVLVVRAEAMRLFVTRADPTQADAGAAAFDDYIGFETDRQRRPRHRWIKR